MNYQYECQGETKDLKDDDTTKVEHKRYFYVVCDKCCNIPVAHLLERNNND